VYSGERKRWTADELKFLRGHFAAWRKPPKFKELRNVQRLMPSLKGRTLPQIKTRVWELLRKHLDWQFMQTAASFHDHDPLLILIFSRKLLISPITGHSGLVITFLTAVSEVPGLNPAMFISGIQGSFSPAAVEESWARCKWPEEFSRKSIKQKCNQNVTLYFLSSSSCTDDDECNIESDAGCGAIGEATAHEEKPKKRKSKCRKTNISTPAVLSSLDRMKTSDRNAVQIIAPVIRATGEDVEK